MKRFTEIHERAVAAFTDFRRSESVFLLVLQEVDAYKVYLHRGFSSLFHYAVKDLGLSEDNACAFIAVARKAREIPEIATEIKAGTLTVSKIRRLTPVLKPNNASLWIEKAKVLSKRELEREIAQVKPVILTPERSRYISSTRLHLELGVSEELMEQLVRAKDILSQQKKRDVTLEEALGIVTGEFLKRQDPVLKAERALEKYANSSGPGRIESLEESEADEKAPGYLVRKSLRTILKHQINYRDRARCTYVHPNGKRCCERRFLELHHIRPVSEGGENSVDNLTTLCSRHHRFWHEHRNQKHFQPNKQQAELFS